MNILYFLIIIFTFISITSSFITSRCISKHALKIKNINTDNRILCKIKEILYTTNDILNKNKITYWIDGGTLLGAVRHKNIIPWDDDGDICIMASQENKFVALKNEFKMQNFGIAKFWGGYKIYALDGTPIKHQNRNWNWSNADIKKKEVFNYKYPFVDVLICDFFDENINGKKSKIVHFKDKNVRSVWNKFYHSFDNLFPLKKYKFGTKTLFGPKNPVPYLDRNYGDWKHVGYKTYDHENMRFTSSDKMVKIKIN